MARYIVRHSYINLIGPIWMPSTVCAQQKTLSAYDIENMRDEEGRITRESIENWLSMNSGDFQDVTDFEASIEDGNETLDFPWAHEESEFTYSDCMHGDEDY